ncbi:MAG: hypothetical protein GX564_11775 [Oligosphaeraceae bacterium]|jgi:hypothetical protein|nr:hypothetical protein [Oligosphaeraceae bacterium]
MMNKNLLLLSVVFLLTALGIQAQVALQLKVKDTRFLRYEPIDLTLTIRNNSGNTLIFGDSDISSGRIFFAVNGQNGKVARSFDQGANPAAGLILAAGDTRELNISINMLHDMQREDTYSVTAYLNHDRLSRTHLSNTVDVEVVEGLRMAEKNVGLPSADDSTVIKSIQLLLLLFDAKEEKMYCLRAQDEENVYAVFRLGPYISGSKPQIEIDGSSSIHILIQVRPRLYSYLIYGFVERNLRLRQQRYYVPVDGTPTLDRQTGFLRIVQARVATEGTDFRTAPAAK